MMEFEEETTPSSETLATSGNDSPLLQYDLVPRRDIVRCLLLLAVLIHLPVAALCATFSAPLNELVGVLDFDPVLESRDATFNFGQQFSEIESVSIEIEAQVFAQQFDVCGTVFNAQPCIHEAHLLGFFMTIDEEDMPFLGSIFSDGLSISDDPHALEASGTGVAAFNNRFGWDVLFDGQGSLTLFWNLVLGNPDRIIQNFIGTSGEILNARVIIVGTPVPEPSTALLLAAGLTMLSGTRLHE